MSGRHAQVDLSPTSLREAFGHFPTASSRSQRKSTAPGGAGGQHVRPPSPWTAAGVVLRSEHLDHVAASVDAPYLGISVLGEAHDAAAGRLLPRRGTGSPVWRRVDRPWSGVHRGHQRVAGELHRAAGALPATTRSWCCGSAASRCTRRWRPSCVPPQYVPAVGRLSLGPGAELRRGSGAPDGRARRHQPSCPPARELRPAADLADCGSNVVDTQRLM